MPAALRVARSVQGQSTGVVVVLITTQLPLASQEMVSTTLTQPSLGLVGI